MSDFTYVNLILTKDVDIAKKHLEDSEVYMLNISDKWSCILTENDEREYDFGEYLQEEPFSDELLSLSEKIPIFYLSHPEDHGFGYSILHNGKVVSSFDIGYGIEEELPADNRNEGISKVFSKVNPENFKLFGYSEEVINQLKRLLKPENIPGTDDFWKDFYKELLNDTYVLSTWQAMPSIFMKILDIENVTFISWDYVDSDPESYSLIE